MLALALPERFIFLKKATQNHAASLSTISGIPSIGRSMQENVCMDVFYSVVKDQYMTGMKHPVALSTLAKSQPCISISQYSHILTGLMQLPVIYSNPTMVPVL